MSLEEVLRKAIERINSDSLNSVEQVKLSVILPILRELDWDDTDPDEFLPMGGKGQIDYTLLREWGMPLIFIKVKRLGSIDDAGEDELFQYAADKKVQFRILTNGKDWNFYLGMKEDQHYARLCYQMELTDEKEVPKHVEFLRECLTRDSVISGSASVKAEKWDESVRKKEARKSIPKVWRAMLETPDEMLCDLLAKEVAGDCGTRPKLEDVEEFLKRLSSLMTRFEEG
ncbi:MAG: hypothetical protein OXG62_17695 [Nitrospinae bacterium]|nr:hypothetical protein [Nitrospinota bacterium]